MKIILLGMPGSGKGTQSEILKKKFSIANISTGAILRQASREQGEQAELIRSFIDKGQLVPDKIIIQMLVNRILQKDCSKGYILDGFPRNLAQGESLDNAGIKVDFVIYLEISEQAIISRMAGRRIHPASGRSYHLQHNPPQKDGLDDISGEPLIQRDDDTPEVIKKRVASFNKETRPLFEFYKSKKVKFVEVDASKELNDVSRSILGRIN